MTGYSNFLSRRVFRNSYTLYEDMPIFELQTGINPLY